MSNDEIPPPKTPEENEEPTEHRTGFDGFWYDKELKMYCYEEWQIVMGDAVHIFRDETSARKFWERGAPMPDWPGRGFDRMQFGFSISYIKRYASFPPGDYANYHVWIYEKEKLGKVADDATKETK